MEGGGGGGGGGEADRNKEKRGHEREGGGGYLKHHQRFWLLGDKNNKSEARFLLIYIFSLYSYSCTDIKQTYPQSL